MNTATQMRNATADVRRAGTRRHARLDALHAAAPTFDEATRLLRLNKTALLVDPQRFTGLVPADRARLAQWVAAYRLKTAAINVGSLRGTAVAHEALAARDIAHTVFKGPLQQSLLYRDPFRRPSGDVDILVAREDFAAAARALEGIGYAWPTQQRLWWRHFLGEQHFAPGERLKGAATVDLHHRLQQPGCPGSLGARDVVARATVVAVAGAAGPFTDAVDTALVCALSAVKGFMHREPIGGYLFDLDAALLALAPAERTAFERRGAAAGLTTTIALATRLLDAVLGERERRRTDILLAERILADVDDDALARMAIASWDPSIAWPRRRTVLWALSGARPVRFARETGWALAAEGARLFGERGAPRAEAARAKRAEAARPQAKRAEAA